MKQLVFGFCAVLLLALGPVSTASAQDWWGHMGLGHTGPGPMGAGADTHVQWPKWPKPHIGRSHQEKLTPLYTSPKSVGWWHKSPAPMGAGADSHMFWPTWRLPHIGWSHGHLEKPTPLYTSPKSVGWWHKSPAPMGAGSGHN
jgi:hypothetical protein